MEINEIMNVLSDGIARGVGKYESFRCRSIEKPICVYDLLRECYQALDSIQQENTFLKNMQRQLASKYSDSEIGEMVMKSMGK